MAIQSLKDGRENEVLSRRLTIMDSIIIAQQDLRVIIDSVQTTLVIERKLNQNQISRQARIIKNYSEALDEAESWSSFYEKENKKLARKLKAQKILNRFRTAIEVAAGIFIIQLVTK